MGAVVRKALNWLRRGGGLVRRAAATIPLVAQLTGGGMAMTGVYLLFGLGVSLLVGGLAVMTLGALREAKVI